MEDGEDKSQHIANEPDQSIAKQQSAGKGIVGDLPQNYSLVLKGNLRSFPCPR